MFLPVTIAKLIRGIYSNRHLISSSGFFLHNHQTKFEFVSIRKRVVCTTQCLWHGEYEWQDPKSEAEIVIVNFVDKDGKCLEIKGKVGDNVLYLAHR